ncbi:MAG: hypothetical protein PHE48_04110 [Candidatus Daviesbacteria bacterium]|nr:hypothetical protein [Candidatus Daviesbacteria bacterium]
MSKSKIVTAVLILLLVGVLFLFIKYMGKGDRLLVNPGVEKAASQSTFPPSTSSYNPPQEIKYDSSTDLKKELDSIDPQVLESDFE